MLGATKVSNPRSLYSISYYFILALIFFTAAYARFSLPPWPLADPDTPGYLEPAISKLAGGAFQHTNGRNFLYPGFLLLILGSANNFAAITFVQHLLGLATGGLMLGCWRTTRQYIRHVSLPVHDGLGLLIAAIYLLARQSIDFEHQLRPEAIAPFFAILNILLTLFFFEERYRKGPSWSGAVCGAVILANSVILVALRSSFGISVLFSIIPVLVTLCHRRETWPRRALVVVTGLVTVTTVMLTERSLARSDVVAKMFLPATLFTIHADLIARQMDEDLARGDCGPRGCGWLSELNASLKEELAKSRRFGKIYPSLGFDPDYLMYGDALRGWRNRFFGGDYDNQYGFYLAYYFHVVRMHPERVAGKVIRQMALFYLGEKHYFITSPRAELGARYTQTVDALRMLMARTPSYPAFNHYFETCKKLSSTHETISQPLTIRGLGGLLSVLYPAVFFGALGAVFLLRGDLRKLYGRFGAMMLLVFSYTFGNCLVTAIAQSLSNTRYIVAQYSFGLLAECMGLLFLVEVAMEMQRRRRAPTEERST